MARATGRRVDGDELRLYRRACCERQTEEH
jgi:hypothetical protein